MGDIKKPKFHILDITKSNYLSWFLDIELELQGQDLAKSIVKDGEISNKVVNAIIFILRHLYESLKDHYHQVKTIPPCG